MFFFPLNSICIVCTSAPAFLLTSHLILPRPSTSSFHSMMSQAPFRDLRECHVQQKAILDWLGHALYGPLPQHLVFLQPLSIWSVYWWLYTSPQIALRIISVPFQLKRESCLELARYFIICSTNMH